ncbi:hypothetical protein BDW22DRAFT_1327712 [Trametopsis cervina]|nr:hypothetical protein BDW22DRAFT_1327712 [Trametopsis cervina]
MTANKLAMSKALGAAFLNHQVEQLEQKMSSGPAARGGGWRDGRRAGLETETSREGMHSQKRTGGGRGGGRGKAQSKRVVSGDYARGWREDPDTKDADVVVVDASVLIHAITHLKKWCRDGRQEMIVIPLEALNTLDLLKKGTTPLAQRARAASRMLEAQVGTNPRIRVQRDDAFVLWDEIPFGGAPSVPSPEWVRRTLCCARWEIAHPPQQPVRDIGHKVVLAVCPSTPEAAETSHPSSTSFSNKLAASPVPLPAPQPNRFEPRSAGQLILPWAHAAGITVLELPPASAHGSSSPAVPRDQDNGLQRRSGEHGRRSSDDEHGGRRHAQQSKPMVERPPAVMAMMEAVSQPSKIVRVLARGEKLDPN